MSPCCNFSVLWSFEPFAWSSGLWLKRERWISAHKMTDLDFLFHFITQKKKFSCCFIVASNDYNEMYFSAPAALPFTCNWRLTSRVRVWITFSIMLHNGEIWHGSKQKFPKRRCIRRLMNSSVRLPFFNSHSSKFAGLGPPFVGAISPAWWRNSIQDCSNESAMWIRWLNQLFLIQAFHSKPENKYKMT